jgi:hypothetical protein
MTRTVWIEYHEFKGDGSLMPVLGSDGTQRIDGRLSNLSRIHELAETRNFKGATHYRVLVGQSLKSSEARIASPLVALLSANQCARRNRVVPVMGSVWCGCRQCDPEAYAEVTE